jgi:hypothetical protein
VTVGTEYGVYAMALWVTGLGVLVLADTGNVKWIHFELFEVSNARLPLDWSFGTINNGGYVIAIWGYEALIEIQSHHDDLINGDPQALKLFLLERDRSDELESDSAKIHGLEAKLAGILP